MVNDLLRQAQQWLMVNALARKCSGASKRIRASSAALRARDQL